MNDFDTYKLSELILAELEGVSTPQQRVCLVDCLRNDPDALEFYVEFVMDYAGLSQPGDISIDEVSEGDDLLSLDTLWAELLNEEKTAPTIEILEEEPARELIQKVEHQKFQRKFPTVSFVTAITSIAALLLMILYVQYHPKEVIQVATISDMANVRWSNSTEPVAVGTRLYTHQLPMFLEKGILEIEYDYGAKVVIEGPAEFSIESDKELYLEQGRLHTHVMEYGKGFAIKTPSSVLVDVGTEFGVNVNAQGDSELHVFKGKVVLNAGPELSRKTPSRQITAGQAAKVSNRTLDVRSIKLRTDFLASTIDPPIIFDDFESYGSGSLVGQANWKSQRLSEYSPRIAAPGIVGSKGIRFTIENNEHIAFAKRPLPVAYDPAVMTGPLYVSALMELDTIGSENYPSTLLVLTLNDDTLPDEGHQNKIEARFGINAPWSLGIQNSLDEGRFEKPGPAAALRPNARYLCVMKITPDSVTNCTVSMGYFDVTNGSLPDESLIKYYLSKEIDPATLVDDQSGNRYYLNHVGLAFYSDSVLVDNLVVSDNWENIQLSARKK